jgi:hypothetical protein
VYFRTLVSDATKSRPNPACLASEQALSSYIICAVHGTTTTYPQHLLQVCLSCHHHLVILILIHITCIQLEACESDSSTPYKTTRGGLRCSQCDTLRTLFPIGAVSNA